MRVLICKFFQEKDVESKIRELVAREQKRVGNRLKIFCVDEPIRKRLESTGIDSVIFPDFGLPDFRDDTSWARAFQLSDELHASAENNDELQYSRINFLTLEHNIVKYVYAVKLSNLLSMTDQNWAEIILVLTGVYNDWLADINSARIKTLRYGKYVEKTAMMARLLWRRLHQGYLIFTAIKHYLRQMTGEEPSAASRREEPEQLKALFVVSTPLYARPALAIGQECRRDGWIPSLATDDATLLPLLQSQNVGYSIKPPFPFSPLSSASYRPLLRKLKNHVNAFYGTELDEFSGAYLCQRTLLTELPELCRQAISGITFLEKLVNGISPDIVCVMPQNGFFQQLASALAKRYDIPTLACSAAWETGTPSSFRKHLHADKLATSGEKMRQMYLDSGIEPERVVATGIAHFDDLFKRDRENDRQTLLSYGINPDKQFIVFDSGNLPIGETEAMLAGVINAVQKIEELRLVVKVHPRERAEPIQAIVEHYRNPRLQVFKDIDLYALLSLCQLVITKGSTIALEAMMIGKPAIILDLSDNPAQYPYVKEGVAYGVFREEDIGPAIFEMLYNEEIRNRLNIKVGKFVRDWAHEPDGGASQRIVILMKEMIAARKLKRMPSR